MAASATDLLKKYKSLFSTTLSTGIGTGTGDTLTPATVTGLPTDTGITLTIDRVDSGGTSLGSQVERITGVISAGNLTSYVRAKDSTTEQAHAGGAVIEMVWNAQDWNDLVDWGLVSHTQAGYLKQNAVVASMITASSITASKITASAVLPSNLAASSVLSGTIAASAVLAGNLAASAIVLGNLAASSVSSGNLNFSVASTMTYDTWSPTLANITLGDGTVTARYTQNGKFVHGYFIFVMGSTSAMGTAPTFTLPVAAHASYSARKAGGVGPVRFWDDSGSVMFLGMAQLFGSATVVDIRAQDNTTTYGNNGTIGSTVPFTWATSDELTVQFSYEAA